MKCSLLIPALTWSAITLVFFGQGNVSRTIEVPFRIVVEPSYPSPFPQEITLTFTNAQGTVVAEALASETFRTTSFYDGQRGFSGQIRLSKDGTFHMLLPRFGTQFRLIVRVRPTSRVPPETQDRYFLKSVQHHGVNLLENPLVVEKAIDEVVITLSKCTERSTGQAECL